MVENIFISNYGVFPHQYFFKNRIITTNSVILDLFDILASIYYYDILTPRKENLTDIEVCVPIQNLELFEHCRSTLELIVNFMTSPAENWTLSFTKSNNKKLNNILFSEELLVNKEFDNVSLFSGGLDSFCGINHNLINKIQTLYITYRTNNIENAQAVKIKKVIDNFNSFNEFLFYKIKIKKIEYTQRTRSLLFLGFAICNSSFYDLKKVILYENGILSLNPDVTKSRVTTKTTHPFVIYKINEILELLGTSIKIMHPFLLKTKGTMISEITKDLVPYIKETITCGKSRQNTKYDSTNGAHCGACIPCILRKISMSTNDYESYDVEYDYQNYNPNHPLHGEFRSSISYFKEFRKRIENKKIYLDFDNLEEKYYNTKTFNVDFNNMLSKFSSEIEYFLKKMEL
jgi:Queuosine biosynthesis protein QueC